MSSLTIGVVLAIIAGIINGSFAAPIKYAKVWKWENIWAVWAVFGMVIFPWLILFITVPHPLAVYQQGGMQNTMMLVAFGAGFWPGANPVRPRHRGGRHGAEFRHCHRHFHGFWLVASTADPASGEDLYASGRT